jgi:ketosteroid isomerase-like protein
VSENKRTVERYLDGFRESDHAKVLGCLTDDVEWVIPGMELASTAAADASPETLTAADRA